MATIFDGVNLTVEVSFTAASGTPTWTDITAYVRSVDFGRGRQRELERPEPGTLTVELLNSDRRFDVYNTAGPYYGYLLPMRQVRVRAVYAAVTYDLWRGYVDSWSQSWDIPQFSICQLTATDSFKVLANRTLEDAYFYEVDAQSPVAWLRLGETSGQLIRDQVSGTFGTITGTLTGADALTAGATDGSIVFDGLTNRVRHDDCARVTALPLSVEAWFTCTVSAGLQLIARQGSGDENDGWFLTVYPGGNILAGSPIQDLTSLLTTASTFDDGLPHHVVYIRTSTVHKIYVDGVDQTCTTGTISSSAYSGLLVGGTIKAGDYFAGTIDEVAIYNVELTYAQILTHYAVGTAAWDQDYTGQRIGRLLVLLGFAGVLDTGNTQLAAAAALGGANALDEILKLVDTESGSLYVDGDGSITFSQRHDPITATVAATFGDSGGEIDFVGAQLAPADELIRNQVTVTRAGGVPQMVEDTASQTSYLTRGYDRSDVLYADDRESRYAAQWILGKYKDANNRVDSLAVNPRGEPTVAFPTILSLDVGSKITLNVRPSTGAVISQTAIIEAIQHSITADSWTTTYALSPVDSTLSYMVIGSATLGLIGTGRMAY